MHSILIRYTFKKPNVNSLHTVSLKWMIFFGLIVYLPVCIPIFKNWIREKKNENSKVLKFHYISETQRLRRSPGCREKRVQGVLDLPRGGSHADQNLLRHGGRRRGLDCKKYKIE